MIRTSPYFSMPKYTALARTSPYFSMPRYTALARPFFEGRKWKNVFNVLGLHSVTRYINCWRLRSVLSHTHSNTVVLFLQLPTQWLIRVTIVLLVGGGGEKGGVIKTLWHLWKSFSSWISRITPWVIFGFLLWLPYFYPVAL